MCLVSLKLDSIAPRPSVTLNSELGLLDGAVDTASWLGLLDVESELGL